MRLYISGKITGDDNYLQKFTEAQLLLEAKGYRVINPALMQGVLPKAVWEEYLYASLTMMDLADGVVMLPDWKESRGACMEYGYAVGQKIPVYQYLPEEKRCVAMAGMETMLLP